MKNMYSNKIIWSVALNALLYSTICAQSLVVDVAKSNIRWEAGKVVGNPHYGSLQLAEGKVTLQNEQIVSGNFVIDMTTISNTDLSPKYGDQLVGHLNSEDFFSTSQFPEARLAILGGSPFKEGKASVQAELTIKDHTESIEFIVEQKGDGLNATLNIDRSKFNVRYGSASFFNDLGDSAIEDFFELAVHLEFLN